MLSAAPPPKERRCFRAAGLAIPGPRSLRLGSASGSNVRGRPRAVNARLATKPHPPKNFFVTAVTAAAGAAAGRSRSRATRPTTPAWTPIAATSGRAPDRAKPHRPLVAAGRRPRPGDPVRLRARSHLARGRGRAPTHGRPAARAPGPCSSSSARTAACGSRAATPRPPISSPRRCARRTGGSGRSTRIPRPRSRPGPERRRFSLARPAAIRDRVGRAHAAEHHLVRARAACGWRRLRVRGHDLLHPDHHDPVRRRLAADRASTRCGRSAVRRPRARAGAASTIGNVIWFVLARLVAGARAPRSPASLLCITIIGIPLGLANFKLIPVSLHAARPRDRRRRRGARARGYDGVGIDAPLPQ